MVRERDIAMAARFVMAAPSRSNAVDPIDALRAADDVVALVGIAGRMFEAAASGRGFSIVGLECDRWRSLFVLGGRLRWVEGTSWSVLNQLPRAAASGATGRYVHWWGVSSGELDVIDADCDPR